MLKHLHISQFVIIDSLDINFDDGLTVLTGETGAGKSILLDAMGLILGDEPDREAIRQGSDQTVLEATFLQNADHSAWTFLITKRLVLQEGQEIRIKRIFDRDQKDEVLVNDQPFSLTDLKELGTHLVEIHGQFANQNFLAPETQLTHLDAFGAYPPNTLETVSKAWDDVERYTHAIDEEKKFFAQAEREKPGIQQFIERATKIGLSNGFYEAQKKFLAELTTARNLCDTFQSANAQLVAQTGAEIALIRVDRTLSKQKDPELDRMKEAVHIALEQTRVAIDEMQTLAPKYLDIDTSHIHTVEKTLADLDELAKERKVPPEKLYDFLVQMTARLERIKNAPARIKKFEAALATANNTYYTHARALTEARLEAAEKLSDAINTEMPLLKLKSAQIHIDIVEDTGKRTRRGLNEATFMARMNPGMPFSPITKTASGGELSRLILAIKMILQEVQTVSTLVFDEIDSGIGGAEAAAVGSRIAKLASGAQVLVVTHSPQVASCGGQHLHVSKKVDQGVTTSVVNTLTLDQRIHEISRMLAGEETTDESKAAATALIEEEKRRAEGFRAERAKVLAQKAAEKAAAAAAAQSSPLA